MALSERRGEDLVIPKGIVERDSPVSSHHSDALYLLCHPFVIVLDERDASLAATDFLIDRGYFLHTHTFPFDCGTSWHTVGGLIWLIFEMYNYSCWKMKKKKGFSVYLILNSKYNFIRTLI